MSANKINLTDACNKLMAHMRQSTKLFSVKPIEHGMKFPYTLKEEDIKA